ncbi:MAG: 3-ketoacyl-ACP reductase [Planctomycetota bacterium]|nr:MAG: 3-ketoacyl-ACP reductase [Planctomycetota bacterium]
MPNQNNNILVTGSSRGLGRGITIELAKGGYSVAINYAGNQVAAEETKSICEESAQSNEQKFHIYQADISDSNQRKNMLEKINNEMGILNGLVNNAGIAPKERADIMDASEESFLELVKTNLMGPYFLTQEVSKSWVNNKKEALSKVIFVTSISSHTASVNRGDYCISKAGLSMAVQLWASRLAAEEIQVYELRPGIMKTDMTSSVTSKYDQLIEDGLVPQKRWGTPEDLGLAVRSLMDGNFPFSTGTVIDIDGGFNIRRL